ncbi:UDP-N-acetylmuramoylalanyl-D-glutamyl-2,6-diaminopimelate--D-alanyl-D-alanine ligase [Pacificispira sp.]|uniref:UDP-N-acetylmuramoylalanyl-D-glutamyl-2, 6-diaminopimelate--D-alanyl-D-alanine ligase n=1 Tax=Pacificispira sp. TaxID=2888761 RepID=UPI003BAB4C06
MTNRPVLWTSDSAGAATKSRNSVKWAATGVTIDSRAVAPGDLFVALKGPNHDGHNYVPQALGEGAAAALVNADWADDKSQNLPLMPVADTMNALVDLARAKRAATGAKVIGVTGSVGKTGTKESLSAALSKLGETHKTMGNLNNHIGLPLTLARLPDTAKFAVLEMGMNHTGEIDVLSRLGRPHVAIITTVEAVHLEFFNSIEGIADAKAEIFDGMEPNGTAILFRDSPLFGRLSAKAEAADVRRILSFGTDADADVRLVDSSLHASCSAATVRIGNDTFDYCIGAPGIHWVMNSLAVLAAIKALGEDPVAAAATFTDVRAPRGRGAYRNVALPDGGSFGLIDESYNASPASVRAAIAVLGRTHPKQGGRKIAVLGDMLELGEAGPGLHASLAKDLITAEIDAVYCCGPLMKSLWDQLPQTMRGGYAENSDGLVAPVRDVAANGDIITVKGSLGSKMAPIVKALDGLAAETASRASGA